MRLIDADALLEEIEQIMRSPWAQDGTFAERTIKRDAMCFLRDLCVRDAPAVDAMEVVRCRDCKYWSGRYDKPGEVTAIGYCGHPNHYIMPLRAGWYCADGAKMDGGAMDASD